MCESGSSPAPAASDWLGSSPTAPLDTTEGEQMPHLTFSHASKEQAKARIALTGPSGSGKTYTALVVGTELGKRVAVIDTERGSAAK
jgi:polynucleotide 5'-kinase involved in rRNA processing